MIDHRDIPEKQFFLAASTQILGICNTRFNYRVILPLTFFVLICVEVFAYTAENENLLCESNPELELKSGSISSS